MSKHVQEAMPWMAIAEAEIGQKEYSGDAHNRRIVEYHAATTLKAKSDEVPWCASFVNWCLHQAQHATTRSAAARSFIKYGTPCNLTRGCIVVLTRGNSATTGHVGFCVRHSASHVWLLGGNQTNSVNVAKYPVGSIIATRWPAAAKKK